MTDQLLMSHQSASKQSPEATQGLEARGSVTKEEQVSRTLLVLLRHHALLTVSLPESSETFTSAILEVDSKNGHLLLDELFPREGHELVTAGTRLGVGARLGGAPISFEGRAVEIGMKSNVAYYKLPFPDAIDHAEQRSDLRVRVAFAYNISVYVWADVDNPFRGKLYDLSSKGVGLRLGRDAEATLASGKTDFTCMIHFPDGETVRTALQVCAVSPRKHQPHIKVGARFIDMGEKDQRIIDRFIAAADRAQVKRLRR